VALANSTLGKLFASGTANTASGSNIYWDAGSDWYYDTAYAYKIDAQTYQLQAMRQQTLTQSDLQKALAQMSGVGLVEQGAPAPDTQRAKARQPESNLAWLNRRVDEVRVRL
jgi:L-amino acid N-acyltransferase YncA